MADEIPQAPICIVGLRELPEKREGQLYDAIRGDKTGDNAIGG